jgi:hypothetical protein
MRVTLWLEDLRPPPEGWVWAKIVEEAKAARRRQGPKRFWTATSINQRAHEQTRTADLISLRVINRALQGYAQDCKPCIHKAISFLRLAQCCTVLRSRWCQSGVRSP